LSQPGYLETNSGDIAGIIFVAVEVRQNNRLLEAQARYSLRQYRSDIADTMMSPHVLEAAHEYTAGGNIDFFQRNVIDVKLS